MAGDAGDAGDAPEGMLPSCCSRQKPHRLHLHHEQCARASLLRQNAWHCAFGTSFGLVEVQDPAGPSGDTAGRETTKGFAARGVVAAGFPIVTDACVLVTEAVEVTVARGVACGTSRGVGNRTDSALGSALSLLWMGGGGGGGEVSSPESRPASRP